MSKRTKAAARPARPVPEDEPTDQRPFKQLWINSCYQQTLLPSAPWHKLEDEISYNLAQKAERQFNHPQRKEMLMEVLGKHFVDKYLSHVRRNPELLEPAYMNADERKRLKIDAENWLNSQMYKAVKEAGHGYLLTGIGPGEPPPSGNYAEFLRQTFAIFTTGLDRELYNQEQHLTKAKAAELIYLTKTSKPDIYKVPAPSRIKPVGSANSGSTQGKKPSTGQLKTMVHTLEGDPPPLWGPQSDAIGAAVVTLLQRDPRKFQVVVGRLHGRQLPGTLRSYIWADVLFKGERKRMKEVYVEKIVRERFALAVTRGLTDLRIKKPTQSPINGLIQNAVIETYSKTTSMVPYKQLEHMKETIRSLNVLYVYDRSYEPYLIHWLFPIQLAFRNKKAMSEDMGEHVLELAMYLDMLNFSCFPKWPHVFAMAEEVVLILQQQDPKLYDHLKRIAPINAQVNPKEFLVQLLHQEREKAEALMKTTSSKSPRAPSSSTQFLADPAIFLRRWIGEGFVSVLDTPCMMYVWDQLFMQSWQQSAIINMCLTLIELLRHRFMEAYDYITMKEVFLVEPCKLYTIDVQMSWIHVENGKDILDINDLYNRQRPMSPASRMSMDSYGQSTPPDGLVQPCGVKNIRTSLTFSADAIERERWLGGLKPDDLRLRVGVYFGSIKMRSNISQSRPVIASSTYDSYGGKEVELEFEDERYMYDMLDISQYDVEKELGAYPYAVFQLESNRPQTSRASVEDPCILGWARIPLHRQSNSTYCLIEGDVTVTLHAGNIPESFITAQPQTPAVEDAVEGSLIGYNCTFSCHVFDPNNEPPNRPSMPVRSPSVIPPLVPPLDTHDLQPTPRTPAVSPPVQPSPQPSVTEPPEEDLEPWVIHKPAAAKSDPKPTTNRDPFVLYIDSVRFIPDNATVVKVTGRILRAGDITNLQDILAAPDLQSSARSPTFPFNMVVNEGRQVADHELLLFLRVYTYDVEMRKVMVIGSCLVRVFTPGKKSKDSVLNVGGHQLQLHSGMPNMREGLDQINASDLDNNPVVPGCTLLIRLLPQTTELVPAPKYSSGYYRSESCKPTASEMRIFASYADNMVKTEHDMVIRLQQAEGISNTGTAHNQMMDWLLNKLDIKKLQGASQPAGNLSLMRCVRYRIRVGLKIQIQAAYGLPDGLYVQCFARVAPGKQTKYMPSTEDGYGREEKFTVTRLEPNSHITAPVWEDEAKEIHPVYDNYSCLVVQVLGFKVLYRPRADHKQPGSLHKPDGSALAIGEEEVIGWSVIPLFEGNSVLSGLHSVPLLTCPLNDELLEEMSQNALSDVLKKRVWSHYTRMKGASINIMLWDAHFDLKDLPEPQNHRNLRELVGMNPSEETDQASSITQQDLVLGMLEEKVRKQGFKGATFKKELAFFNDAMTKNFNNLIDDYCLQHGLAPL